MTMAELNAKGFQLRGKTMETVIIGNWTDVKDKFDGSIKKLRRVLIKH